MQQTHHCQDLQVWFPYPQGYENLYCDLQTRVLEEGTSVLVCVAVV